MASAGHDDRNIHSRIHVPKTSEIIADRIRAQIIRGEIAEGDNLPPEGQLMDSLQISRPTLREAYRILESEGLIQVVRGSRTGARVRKPTIDMVSRYAGYVLESQGTTIADLYQARLAIEPTVVRWLASENGDSGLAPLHELLKDMEGLLVEQRYDAYVDMVETFHQMLVAVSGRKTVTLLSRMLFNLAAKHQREFESRHPRSEEVRRKSLLAGQKSYAKLLDLIEKGDVEAAVAHWRLHLQNANATWAGPGEGDRVVDSLGM